MTTSALVILADGCEEIEAVTPIDVLRRAGIEVTVAGLTGASVTGARGVRFGADTLLDSVPADRLFDAVVLPGGMPGSKHLGASDRVREIATRHVHAGRVVAAICAAPAMTLARFGLLAGRRATCYPGCEKDVATAATWVNAPVVVDGPVVTSRGPGTALPFAFALVRILAGPAAADQLAAAMQAS
jgi:4-methyl-5(b-hydroxyethyl)-thiazole monophosphate biosynthesis